MDRRVAGWLAEVNRSRVAVTWVLGRTPHREHGSMMGSAAVTWPLGGSLFPRCPSHLPRAPTLEASVRMSLESFTRHCRGTVTSITFTFSLFLLLSLTNFPYQALTMMSPEDRPGQDCLGRQSPCSLAAGTMFPAGTQHPPHPLKRPGLLTHSGLFGLDYSSDRFLHQPNLQGTRTLLSRPP